MNETGKDAKQKPLRLGDHIVKQSVNFGDMKEEATMPKPSELTEELNSYKSKYVDPMMAYGALSGNPDEISCPYCKTMAPWDNKAGSGRCPGCGEKLVHGINLNIPSTERLAHIHWRTAKQLVSLLEKEYGFGK